MNLAPDRSIYDQLATEMPLPDVWAPMPWVPFAEMTATDDEG
jgi:hypothetical protein